MIRVLVCDDNPIVREGLVAVIDAADDLCVVGRAGDGRTVVDEARRLDPDVVLLDVRMPEADGISAATALSGEVRILMLTYEDDAEVVIAAVRAGAHGYLVHGEQEPRALIEAIRSVAGNESALGSTAASVLMASLREAPVVRDVAAAFDLTRREAEVLDHASRGRSNREIADRLFLSPRTVKNHLQNAYGKLGVSSRADAVAVWLRGPSPEAGR